MVLYHGYIGSDSIFLVDVIPLLGGSYHDLQVANALSRAAPLPNSLNGSYMGVTNHLLTGMILQVEPIFLTCQGSSFHLQNPEC